MSTTGLMGRCTWSLEEGILIAPARIEAPYPCTFRLAQYPDGRQVLQGAYTWTQGLEGGIVWRDVPIVTVDEHGRELS